NDYPTAWYKIQRSPISPNGPWELIGGLVSNTVTTYTDSNLTPGTTLYYRLMGSTGLQSSNYPPFYENTTSNVCTITLDLDLLAPQLDLNGFSSKFKP